MKLLYTTPQEAPRAGQISGADPTVMAEAARVVEERGFDIVDLNFECPIRRLLGRNEGGALMADPPAIERIVAAVVHAVSIPVTLKIRTGPDAGTETAVEVARRAEQAGAAAVDVHARSVNQAYVGGPDWSVVSRVKQTLRIPVAGSGGIRAAHDAMRYLAESKADAVAIGRGCLGNPWIFRETRALVQGGGDVPAPTPAERGRVLQSLVEEEFRIYGAAAAMRRLARTSCYFAKFAPGFASFRDGVHRVRDLAEFRRLVRDHFR
jgi:tRNA-dihydrouridine synthase B